MIDQLGGEWDGLSSIRPLHARYQTCYEEKLALNLLNHYEVRKYKDFYLTDAPDIQNGKFDIGIEVTCAVSERDARIDGVYIKYRYENNPNKKEKYMKQIEADGAHIDQYGISYPVKDKKYEMNVIKDAIRKKNRKAVTYVEKGFERLILVVLYKEFVFPFRLWEIKKIIDDALDGGTVYSKIYYFFPQGMVKYELEKHQLLMRMVEREKYQGLCKDAYNYAMNKQSISISKSSTCE